MAAPTASTRGRANRAKGRAFEQQVAQWLRGHGFPGAERAVRNGWRSSDHYSEDPFDLVGTPGLLWSLKNEREASEHHRRRQLDEVHDEAERRGLVGLLVCKRVGRADIGSAWCYRMLPQPYVQVHHLPVRAELADMAMVLRAEGYGDGPP